MLMELSIGLNIFSDSAHRRIFAHGTVTIMFLESILDDRGWTDVLDDITETHEYEIVMKTIKDLFETDEPTNNLNKSLGSVM